jgi:ATP-binding cassette subfamily B multidrug efflux pump
VTARAPSGPPTPSRRLLRYALKYRGSFLVGFLCVIVTSAVGVAAPWVLKYAIDDLMLSADAGTVRLYAVALVALAAVGGFFRFLMRRIIIGASRDIEYDLRNDFFAHLQRLDLAYFQRHRTGDLMSRATNDLAAVRMMIGPAVMYSTTTGLVFVVALGLMFSINAGLTWYAMAPLPCVSLFVAYFGSIIHRRFAHIQEQLSEVSAMTQETLSGVRVVRAYRQEPFEIERFRLANEEYVRRNRALIRVQSMYFPSMGFLMGIGGLLVLWLGSLDVVAGEMSVGELVAFNAYLMMLTWPMIAFGWVTNLLQRGMASWKRILEVLDAQPDVTDAALSATLDPAMDVAPKASADATGDAAGDAAEAHTITGRLEFRHLTFAYGDDIVLHDISAVLPAGTTTAIVGPTGSGKSTLLSLLARLYEPPAGTVFVDGVDVRQIPLPVLRGAIGFVPQEPFLFGSTIAENIAFGALGNQDHRARVEEVAAVARLDKDLAAFPAGFDTVIGERGITLSGGQKQRAAIARALMVDPTILILDDALSAVDTYTEEEILGRLSGVMRQRTSIIVSHRVSTVRSADQILVCVEGRIVERGTHHTLVAAEGVYADLYRKQLLEEELAAS